MIIPQEWVEVLAHVKKYAPSAVLVGGALRDRLDRLSQKYADWRLRENPLANI